MKKVIYLLFLIPFVFISCSKDNKDVDQRDDYVGNWNQDAIGSLSLVQDGNLIATMPISANSTDLQVTKSGTDKLIIDGMSATVSGTKLIIESDTQTQTQNGLTMTVTTSYSGTLAKNMITIKEAYSGFWSQTGFEGTITGNTVYTFTK